MPTFTEQMATLLNWKFDIPKIPEFAEQVIFEKLVWWASAYISPEVKQKILDAGDGLDEAELEWWTNKIVNDTVLGYISTLPNFLQYFARMAIDSLREQIRPWIEYILSFAVRGKSMPMAVAALEDGLDPDAVTSTAFTAVAEPEPAETPAPMVFTMTDDDEDDTTPEGE